MSDVLVSRLTQLTSASVGHLHDELKKLQIGRASSGMVEDALVEAYGTVQPLKALATISTPDSRTIQIAPWDKSLLSVIDSALSKGDLHFNAQSDGIVLRIPIPQPTEERRKELVKGVHARGEAARIAVRNDRHQVMGELKGKKDAKQISDDMFDNLENMLQKVVEQANGAIDEAVKQKEQEVMKV